MQIKLNNMYAKYLAESQRAARWALKRVLPALIKFSVTIPCMT